MTIQIHTTDAQKAVLETLPSNVALIRNEPGATLMVYVVVDDYEVTLYVIQPDGTYITQSLENGLGGGWTTRDEEGNEIEYA